MKFWLFYVKLDLESQSQSPWGDNHLTNNGDLNQGISHLCSKFGDPILNGGMSYVADKLKMG